MRRVSDCDHVDDVHVMFYMDFCGEALVSKACGFRGFKSSLRLFALLVMPVLFSPGEGHAEQHASDREIYHLAAEYCRGSAPRPMALSSDHRVLCFDGWADDGMDLSLVRDLADHGLFVVRSFGGNVTTAIALSDLLRDRHATVVVYDYCLSACAGFFLIASDQSYVLAGSLVAWRSPVTGFDDCASLIAPRDSGPKKIQRIPCPDISSDHLAKHKAIISAVHRFYSERTVDPQFDPPPQSLHVRRVLANSYEETGVDPNLAWTLNPRHQSLFKTKLDYEAYPANQEEVDAMAARLHLGRVIYDP